MSLFKEEYSIEDLIPKNKAYILEDHLNEVLHVSFSKNGKYLATCSADKTIIVYEVSKINKRGYFPKILKGHFGAVTFVSWNDDNKTICTTSVDKTIKVWDISIFNSNKNFSHKHFKCSSKTIKDDDCCIMTYDRYKHSSSTVCWCVGSNILTIDDTDNSILRIYNKSSKKMIKQIDFNYAIMDIDCNTTTKDLIIISSNNIYIYHIEESNNIWVKKSTLKSFSFLNSTKISKMGHYALCYEDGDKDNGKVKLLNLKSKLFVKEFKGSKQKRFYIKPCFCESQEKIYLIFSGSEDGIIYGWDANNGKLVTKLEGHSDVVGVVDYNFKKKMLASASDDHSVIIWI